MAKIILAFVATGSILLLAACGILQMLTSTPTPLPTLAPTVTAGISIQGHVWLNSADGPGLANVQIYAKGGYGSTEGSARLLGTTDSDGYYWNGNAIPLMIVWAELDGYVFEPESQEYMGPGQLCTDACDFIARPVK
jgi:hypothetical protein